jgi:hypothetical protein
VIPKVSSRVDQPVALGSSPLGTVTHVQALGPRQASDTDPVADELGEEERWFAECAGDAAPAQHAVTEEQMTA